LYINDFCLTHPTFDFLAAFEVEVLEFGFVLQAEVADLA